MADQISLTEDLKQRVIGRAAIGHLIAFDLKEDGFIHIDATKEPVEVSNDRKDADVAIIIGPNDLAGLLDGSVNGQSLMMTGRAKMQGNPSVLMRLRDLIG
jgi:putative sterol carrier protein